MPAKLAHKRRIEPKAQAIALMRPSLAPGALGVIRKSFAPRRFQAELLAHQLGHQLGQAPSGHMDVAIDGLDHEAAVHGRDLLGQRVAELEVGEVGGGVHARAPSSVESGATRAGLVVKTPCLMPSKTAMLWLTPRMHFLRPASTSRTRAWCTPFSRAHWEMVMPW